MLETMERSFRHFLEGFLSAFTLFPPEPDLTRLRRLRPKPDDEALRDAWVEVGDALGFAIGRAYDEAGTPREQGPEQREPNSHRAAIDPSHPAS